MIGHYIAAARPPVLSLSGTPEHGQEARQAVVGEAADDLQHRESKQHVSFRTQGYDCVIFDSLVEVDYPLSIIPFVFASVSYWQLPSLNDLL